jgi:16S rRNA (uracil1498-N3)-methyltransferase
MTAPKGARKWVKNFLLRSRMDLFLTDHLKPGINTLHADESFHCVKTTRHRVGDSIWLSDGQGQLARGKVLNADIKAAQIHVEMVETQLKPSPQISLGVALLKNDSRFEWLIEKAVELGVSQIIPIQTKRTEKVYLKTDRLERIITAAMKQSIKAWRPSLLPAIELEKIELSGFDLILLAHCLEGEKIPITQVSGTSAPLLLIGPEGDFTREEIDFVLKQGATEISLGNHRLRTETAAIAGLAVLTMLQQ